MLKDLNLIESAVKTLTSIDSESAKISEVCIRSNEFINRLTVNLKSLSEQQSLESKLALISFVDSSNQINEELENNKIELRESITNTKRLSENYSNTIKLLETFIGQESNTLHQEKITGVITVSRLKLENLKIKIDTAENQLKLLTEFNLYSKFHINTAIQGGGIERSCVIKEGSIKIKQLMILTETSIHLIKFLSAILMLLIVLNSLDPSLSLTNTISVVSQTGNEYSNLFTHLLIILAIIIGITTAYKDKIFKRFAAYKVEIKHLLMITEILLLIELVIRFYNHLLADTTYTTSINISIEALNLNFLTIGLILLAISIIFLVKRKLDIRVKRLRNLIDNLHT